MADADVQEPPVGSGPAQVAPWLRARGQTLDPTKSNWCGAFTNATLAQNGQETLPVGKAQIATNWTTYGAPVTDAVQPNDVVVLPRGRPTGAQGGHVGVATGNTRVNPATGQPEVQMKSGNAEGNRVSVDWVPASQAVVRRGTQVASDDVLKLLPAAPSAAAPAAKGGAKEDQPDDPLSMLPPAPVTAAAAPEQPGGFDRSPAAGQTDDLGRPVDELGRPMNQTSPTDYGNFAGRKTPWIDTSITPSENVMGMLPFSRDPKTGEFAFALPNVLRGGLTEGPQLDPQGKLVVPGATINPDTNALGVTPAAAGFAGMVNPSLLRFSGPGGLATAAMPPGTLNTKAPLPPEFTANALHPDLAARATETERVPGTATGIPTNERTIQAGKPPEAAPGGPSPGMGAPQPQAVGAAATPPGVARFTPEEETAYRSSAEGRKLMENQIIGEPDTAEHIPGITANKAELEQSVEVARELKALTGANAKVSETAKQAAQDNDTTRRGWLQDTAKDEVAAFRERAARQADIEQDKAAVFAPENVTGEVSTQPLLEHIDATLNVPENRQNSAMQSILGDLRKRLSNKDGSAKTMEPREAWGLRQDIDRMTDKRAQSDDRNLHYVAHDLNGLSDVLDKQIEGVAPGYGDMLAKYKAHSERLSEMELLQKATNDMLSKPTLRYSDFQRFMQKVVNARRTPSNEINPYKAISDETMQRLWALRDDLRRSASALELAKAPGSDTVPNIIDTLKQYAKMGGIGAAHAAANAISPGYGSLAISAMQAATKPITAARLAARQQARARELIYPPQPSAGQNPLAAP